MSIAAEVVAVFRGEGSVSGSPVDRALLERIRAVRDGGRWLRGSGGQASGPHGA